MKLYGGIDLHANNSVLVVLDEQERVVYEKRLGNDLDVIVRALEPYRGELEGVVVESTFNWYWLVDGLQEGGYRMHLANTTAIQQYSGLKYADDSSDARWLAQMLRLGVLPEGYIYPKEERAVRDLLRKRAQLVHQKVTQILSVQNLFSRNVGWRPSANAVRQLSFEEVERGLGSLERAQAVKSSLVVMHCLEEEVECLEREVKARVKLRPAFQWLRTVPGIGIVLALTIMLEAGAIERFARVGNFASYCRCVDSQRLSNGKRKGRGNVKNGNRYLAWAFIEAASFAIRYSAPIKRYYQRKAAKTNAIVARKAVAHKLARACYYILRDHVPFQVEKAFG